MISAGENGSSAGHHPGLAPNHAVRRIAEDLGRIERREIRPVRVVRVLERRPRRVDDEPAEDREDDEGLKPPCVAPLRFTEAAVKERERCGHREMIGEETGNSQSNEKSRGKWTSLATVRQSRHRTIGGLPSIGCTKLNA